MLILKAGEFSVFITQFIHPLFTVHWRITWRIAKVFLRKNSEANNSGLQTQQCPIGQVARNPCRERFNTKRTAT